MSQPELLRRVVEALDSVGIDYMVTGAIASSLQGEPRSTHDLDLVVEISQDDVPSLLAAFPRPGFYVDEIAIREAIRTNGMFNVIEPAEGDKVDFWLLTDTPFDRSRFARRIQQEVFGIHIHVSAPEDTILMKLRWSRESGGSEKYLVDALRVYEVQAGQLDEGYIEEWAPILGIEDLWRRVRDEAEVIDP